MATTNYGHCDCGLPVAIGFGGNKQEVKLTDGQHVVMCRDEGCKVRGRHHVPMAHAEYDLVIVHFDNRRSWVQPVARPSRIGDAVPIVAAMRAVPAERRLNAVAVAVDAFCQTGGALGQADTTRGTR